MEPESAVVAGVTAHIERLPADTAPAWKEAGFASEATYAAALSEATGIKREVDEKAKDAARETVLWKEAGFESA